MSSWLDDNFSLTAVHSPDTSAYLQKSLAKGKYIEWSVVSCTFDLLDRFAVLVDETFSVAVNNVSIFCRCTSRYHLHCCLSRSIRLLKARCTAFDIVEPLPRLQCLSQRCLLSSRAPSPIVRIYTLVWLAVLAVLTLWATRSASGRVLCLLSVLSSDPTFWTLNCTIFCSARDCAVNRPQGKRSIHFSSTRIARFYPKLLPQAISTCMSVQTHAHLDESQKIDINRTSDEV